MAYVKASIAAARLGITTEYLRREAVQGNLPDGAVIATLGGHHSYDVQLIQAWMLENFRRQTRIPRLLAAGKREEQQRFATNMA